MKKSLKILMLLLLIVLTACNNQNPQAGPEDSDPQSRLVKASFHVSRQEVVSPELVEEGSMPEDLGEYLKATKQFQ